MNSPDSGLSPNKEKILWESLVFGGSVRWEFNVAKLSIKNWNGVWTLDNTQSRKRILKAVFGVTFGASIVFDNQNRSCKKFEEADNEKNLKNEHDPFRKFEFTRRF